jgi:hypothetical protein
VACTEAQGEDMEHGQTVDSPGTAEQTQRVNY